MLPAHRSSRQFENRPQVGRQVLFCRQVSKSEPAEKCLFENDCRSAHCSRLLHRVFNFSKSLPVESSSPDTAGHTHVPFCTKCTLYERLLVQTDFLLYSHAIVIAERAGAVAHIEFVLCQKLIVGLRKWLLSEKFGQKPTVLPQQLSENTRATLSPKT